MISEISVVTSDVRSQSQKPSKVDTQQSVRESGKDLPAEQADLPDITDKPVVDLESLERATENLNEFLQGQQRSLQFTRDDSSGRTVIKVINKDTQEVVRQFPPDELLSLSKLITESLQESNEFNTGLLVEEQG